MTARICFQILFAVLLLFGCRPAAADTISLLGTEFFGGTLFDIDPATGFTSNPRNTPSRLIDIEAADSGVVYAIHTDTDNLFTIDVATGTADELIGPTGLDGTGEGDMSFCPLDGRLYAVTRDGGGGAGIPINLYTIDLDDGSASLVGQVGVQFENDISGLSFDLEGNLFAIDTTANRLLQLDKATGAMLFAQPLSEDLGSVAGMDVHPETGVMYVADGEVGGTNTLYTLNTVSGLLTAIGPTGGGSGLGGLTFRVPEPSSATLIMIVTMLMSCRFRRRRIG